MDHVRKHLARYSHWQYGLGEHSSAKEAFLGSTVIRVLSDSGSKILICNVVLNGSLQWIVGRNVPKKAEVFHCNCNWIRITSQDGSHDFIFF